MEHDDIQFKFKLGDKAGCVLGCFVNGDETLDPTEIMAALIALNYLVWESIPIEEEELSIDKFVEILGVSMHRLTDIGSPMPEPMPMMSFGNDEIREMQNDPVVKGDLIICQNCGKTHPVQLAKDDKGEETNTLGFIHCPDSDASYLVSIAGGLLPNCKRKEKE